MITHSRETYQPTSISWDGKTGYFLWLKSLLSALLLFRDFLRSKMNGSGAGVYFPATSRTLSQDFEHISNQMAHFLLTQGLKTGQAG